MSERPKQSKIPLGARLKYYLDRLRMPKLNAELVLLDRLVGLTRKEIDEWIDALKLGADLLDKKVVDSMHGLLEKDPWEIMADERRRMELEKKEVKGCLGKLERLMSMHQRIMRILESGQSERLSPDVAEALDLGLDDFLRRLEEGSEESRARLEEAFQDLVPAIRARPSRTSEPETESVQNQGRLADPKKDFLN
jgi:hypothetical protein